ncbi:ComEA family DNA-binding protein [Mycobacterium sp. OTB74]|uniref:ComEA family DNA-binding protein n=1 Tax=Mycobacterium sp. OTB74 TaxID=1853452 RepID=UPI0024770FBB|nr:ComEA family DNA-binding protein [Mycobacterium sp. OTB74]MDH6245887.1 competence protein ComEA [Mycobacterium sp. OTB74]
MDIESPTQRLTRRIGAEPDPESAADGDDDTSLSRWLPESVPTGPGWLATVRADPGRAGVIALAVLGVVAVLVTVVAVLGDDKPPVTAAKLPPVQMVSSSTTGAAPAPKAEPVVVSVVGLVHKPGVVTLPAGSRITDALAAAGGALGGADLVGLNMARRVEDGEQILVGITAPLGAPSSVHSSVGSAPNRTTAPTTTGKASGPKELVDLNTATAEQLDVLPGVGPVTAQAIVGWRGSHGRFTSVDQLGEVDGIGPGRLEKLRALVKV